MKYLFLPGNSNGNREWIDNLSNEFNLPKIVKHYNHWDSGEKSINFQEELIKLQNLEREEYIVVAKSMGSVLTLKALNKKILNINKCFFIGFPLFYIDHNNEDLKELLNTNVDITFIQKLHDFQSGFEELKERITDIKKGFRFIPYQREGEPDDNHHYADVRYLKDIITSS